MWASVDGVRRRWRRGRAMSMAEWRLLAEAWVLSLVIAAGLRWLRFNRLLRLLERLRAARPAGAGSDVSPARAARLVETAAARSVASTCLTKALVLHELLQHRGVETELLISAKRADDRLEAHAWLRHGDQVLLGGGEYEGYVPLWSHGGRRGS